MIHLLQAVSVLPFLSPFAWLALQHEPADFGSPGPWKIRHTRLEQIVPGDGLPADLALMDANNNLDVVEYQGRCFLAWRTAPTHFASPKTRLVVASSEDRKAWRVEAQFHLGCDLREPRFLVFNDTLFLYFFRAGVNMIAFEPEHIHMSVRGGDGAWSEPCEIFEPGFVVWRAKAHGGKAYMTVYRGGDIYNMATRSGEVRLLTSDDGRVWEPISDAPQVDLPAASEAAFAFDDAGNLVATVRLETSGSLVCTAAADNLAQWETHYTPYKYDSAVMFGHAGRFYVIARRNVAGPFNRDLWFLPQAAQNTYNLLRYSLTRKRTALYRVDLERRELAPLFDFPSKGDTAYAGVVPLDENCYYVVNYSSPLEGPDWTWIGGQLTGTHIYATELCFE